MSSGGFASDRQKLINVMYGERGICEIVRNGRGAKTTNGGGANGERRRRLAMTSAIYSLRMTAAATAEISSLYMTVLRTDGPFPYNDHPRRSVDRLVFTGDGKEPELSKNEPNKNPVFAQNRTRTLLRKEPNRTRAQMSRFLLGYFTE